MAYLLDPMHIVKNIASSLYWYTTSKESNNPNMRNNLKDTNTKCSLWITHNSDRLINVPDPCI